MTPDELAGWRLLAQLATFVVTIVGLTFVWWQIRAARKTADLSALIELNREQRALVCAFGEADDGQELSRFYDLVNYMEVLAAALHKKLMPPTTCEIATDLLYGFILDIQDDSNWTEKIADSIDAPTTYEHLHRFMTKHRTELTRRREARQTSKIT